MGSIQRKFLVLLRRAKRLDRSLNITQTMKEFMRATPNSKRISIRNINRFLRLKPAFDKFQIMEQRERMRVRRLIKAGKNPSLARVKMLDKKGDRLLRVLDSGAVDF